MLLTSNQTAEKLGIRMQTLRRLVEVGKLTAVIQNGEKRRQFGFDPKVVAEFKKTYAPVKRATAKTQFVKPGNGHATDVPLPFPNGTFVHESRLIQIVGRLDSVEEKLDALTEALSNLVEAWK
jgi:hypothetical protein